MKLPYVRQEDCYGKRIVVVRKFLKDVKPAPLAVYVQLLNDFPYDIYRKGDIVHYAGGEIVFTAYPYLDGYVLQGTLSQVQNDLFRFWLVNPYREGEKIFQGFFDTGLTKEDKNVIACVEKLLMNKEETDSHSYRQLLSQFGLPGSDLVYSDDQLKAVRRENDLKDLEKRFSASPVSDKFVMDSKRSSAALDYSFPLLQYQQKKLVFHAQDETLAILVSHEKVETMSSRQALLVALNLVLADLKEKLEQNLSLDYETHAGMLDQSHSYLSFTFAKGRGKEVKERLEALLLKGFGEVDGLRQEDFLATANLLPVKWQMNSQDSLNEWIMDTSLGIPYEASFALTTDDIRKMLGVITFAGILSE